MSVEDIHIICHLYVANAYIPVVAIYCPSFYRLCISEMILHKFYTDNILEFEIQTVN